MKSPRTHGITALVTLALTLSALLPWNALAGEVNGMILPDPQPVPQQSAGDPDASGGGVAFEPLLRFVVMKSLLQANLAMLAPQFGLLPYSQYLPTGPATVRAYRHERSVQRRAGRR